MLEAGSNAAFVHGGLSRRARRMRGQLHRVLLALVAVLVCIGVTGPLRGIAAVQASVAAVTSEIAVARLSGPLRVRAVKRASDTPPPRLDTKAVEPERDDDDDPLAHVPGEAPPLACAPPPGADRAPGLEVGTVTSRFVLARGLARAPPV